VAGGRNRNHGCALRACPAALSVRQRNLDRRLSRDKPHARTEAKAKPILLRLLQSRRRHRRTRQVRCPETEYSCGFHRTTNLALSYLGRRDSSNTLLTFSYHTLRCAGDISPPTIRARPEIASPGSTKLTAADIGVSAGKPDLLDGDALGKSARPKRRREVAAMLVDRQRLHSAASQEATDSYHETQTSPCYLPQAGYPGCGGFPLYPIHPNRTPYPGLNGVARSLGKSELSNVIGVMPPAV
jgi:hypothetical protein